MKKITKLQLGIFYVLLVLLPSQLGLHFWPDWAYFNGIRVDYFSPTLFLTDILIGLLLVLSLPQLRFSRKASYLLLGLALFAGVNSYLSLSPALTAYKWLKLLEMGLLYIWVKNHFAILSRKWVMTSLALAVGWQMILVLGQFITQHSLNGWWYYLGERNFSLNTPGIATLYIGSDQVLRPYGTFPHSNVLAAFFTIVSLLNAEFLRYKCGKSIRLLATWTIAASQVGILLTLSLPAILINFLALGLVLGKKRLLVALSIPIFILTASKLTAIGFYEQSFFPRQELMGSAISSWLMSPFIGVGLGTGPLITALAKLNLGNFALVLQPVHNFWLLLLAETGIVGLGAAFFWLLRRKFSVILGVMVFLSLWDHYFLTTQQGLLILVLALAFSFPLFPGKMKR